MVSLTVSAPRLRERGPVLPVRVGVGEAAERALKRAGRPVPPALPLLAMVDTGAGRSVIQKGLAAELGLTPVGAVEIDTPSSIDMASFEYFVRIWFNDRLSVESKALEAPLPVPRLRALIGRDVLAQGQLVYDGRRERFELKF